MSNSASTQFIGSLHALLPPARVLHVGVGSGVGLMHLWRGWEVEQAWLIDAGAASLAWLEALAPDHPHWRIATATLSSRAGEVPFFHASNPAESGLIAPAALRSLWPNLQESASELHRTQTLDALLGTPAAPGPDGDWLLIDCLSALDILQGAQQTLHDCSVVWTRTLRAALSASSDQDSGALATSLAQLHALLEPLGFRCVHLCDCTHPAMAEAVFVRNWHGELQKARAAQQEQAGLLEDRHKRIVQVQQALSAQTGAAAQQQARAQEAAAAHQTQLDGLAAQHQALAQEAAAAHQTQLDGLAARHQALAQEAAAAHQTQLDGLAARQQALAQEAAAAHQMRLDGLIAQHQQETALLEERLSRLAQQCEAQAGSAETAASAARAQHSASEERIERLTQERNEHAWQTAAAQQRIDELEQTAAQQLHSMGVCASELRAQQDEAGRQQGVLAECSEALAASREALASLEAQLAGRADEQENQARKQARLEQETAALKQAASAKDEEIEQRDAEIALLFKRQQQLAEELVRAEAQIDLIKDVLLREQGL